MSDADTAAGSVWLTLTFTNNGVCYAETDSVEVTVKTAATVTAASDTILCTEVLDSLSLNGTVSGGSGKGEWSTDGFGSFSPSDTVKDLNYVFNAQDTSMKQLTLTFPSVAACANDTDGATVDFIDAPIVDAGPDMSLCEGQAAALNGSLLNAWEGVWNSSGSGDFLPDDSTFRADYLPDSWDMDSGKVTLYLNSYGGNSAQCGNSPDTLKVSIYPQPVAAFSIKSPFVGDNLGLSDSPYVNGDSFQQGELRPSKPPRFRRRARDLLRLPGKGDLPTLYRDLSFSRIPSQGGFAWESRTSTDLLGRNALFRHRGGRKAPIASQHPLHETEERPGDPFPIGPSVPPRRAIQHSLRGRLSLKGCRHARYRDPTKTEHAPLFLRHQHLLPSAL